MASNSEHKVIITAQDNATATLKKVEGNFDNLGSMIKKAVAAVGAFEIAKGVIKLGSQAEQAAISFETLLKSGTKATAMLKDIEDFAAKTPFEKAGLTEGVQKLLGMGIAAERALPTMQVLGDAIGAVGRGQADLDGVVLALGQIQAKGKLSMEETLQIAERGLPIFDILREQLGLTQDQIGNLGKEGIKSSVAIDAILTGLNTRFAGAMEKQSKTLAGQWSTAMDNVKNAATSIIGPVNSALTSGLAAANGFFAENDKSIKETGGRIVDTFVDLLSAGAATFGGIAGSAGIAFDAITDKQAESGTSWMENFRIVQNVLTKALAGILIAVNTGIQSVFGAAAQAINALRTIGNVVGSILSIIVVEAVNTVIDALNVAGSAINDFAASFGVDFRVGVIGQIDKAGKAVGSLKSAFSEGFADMDATQSKFAENLGKSNAAIYDSLFKSVDDYDAKLKTSNDTAAKGPSIMERNLAAIKKIQDDLKAGKADMFSSAGNKSGKSAADKMKEEIDKTKESASSLYSQLDKEAEGHKERVSKLQRGYREMKDRLGEMVTNGREQIKTLNSSFKEMGEKFSEEIGKMKSDLATLDKDFGKQTSAGLKDLATRAAEIKKQVADANTELVGSGGTGKEEEIRDRIRKLQAEFALAKTKVSDEDIKKAQEEADKGETQKIIDRMAADKEAYDEKRKALEDEISKKTEAHNLEMTQFKEKAEFKKAQLEGEILDFQRQMKFKQEEIQKEVDLYVSVVQQKRAVDDAYFANFSKQIKAQASELDAVLAKMSKAGIAGGTASPVTGAQARADGGSVMPGQAYVVGENRPELFIPDRPGTIVPQVGGGGVSVSINMGGVTVRSDSDIRAIASAIKDELTREIRLAKIGIA